MAVRVAFVGCGGIASRHMQSLQQLAVQFVSFCDLDEGRAQRAAAQYNGKAYTDFDKMLKSEKFDALWVCVPPHGHVGQEQKAAEKGIHIMVEKPVANNLASAREVEAAIAKAGVVNCVAYHWRYMDITRKALEILKDYRVGMALGYWIGGLPGVAWWRVQAESGGQLVEQTTHIVDLCRYLVGEVRRVHAVGALSNLTDVPNLDVWDVACVNLEFENGAIGNVSNSCMIPQGHLVGLHLFARDLVLEIGGRLVIKRPRHREEIEGSLDPNLEENKAFLRGIEQGDSSGIRSSYADGVKTLAVTLAADQSGRTHQVVEL